MMIDTAQLGGWNVASTLTVDCGKLLDLKHQAVVMKNDLEGLHVWHTVLWEFFSEYNMTFVEVDAQNLEKDLWELDGEFQNVMQPGTPASRQAGLSNIRKKLRQVDLRMFRLIHKAGKWWPSTRGTLGFDGVRQEMGL